MKSRFCLPALLSFLVAVGTSCSGTTTPEATLALTTTPDFSATVSQVTVENGNSPAGPISQIALWVIISPATAANAGVVVGSPVPVFIRSSGRRLTTASRADIHAGDVIDVWHDFTVGYGAVEGPPGAPTYGSTQVVIVR
jgi:hypothetical protein